MERGLNTSEISSERAASGPPALSFPPEAEREYALVLACLRARFDDESIGAVLEAASAGVDPTRLAATARRHRLGGVVMKVLRDAGLGEDPMAVGIAGAASRVAMRGLHQANALTRVHDLLVKAGIVPLALKGTTLAASIYRDVGVRPSGDLDLLVRLEDLMRARALLIEAGFRPDPQMTEAEASAYLGAGFAYSFIDDERGVEIEIHPSLAHRAFQYAPDMEGVWDRAVPVTIGGREVLTLSPEDLVLFLCVHGAKHEWDQLIWVCDVAESLRAYPGLDWTTVQRRAAETGSLRMLQLGLYLAHVIAGVGLPLEAAVLAAHPSLPHLARQAWSRMLDPIDRKPGLVQQLRFHIGVRERPTERWAQAREKVTDHFRDIAQGVRVLLAPSAADQKFVALPSRLTALYYIVRPVRVLMRGRERDSSA